MILSDTLLRQTRIHFPRFEEAQVKISPIEKGGSDRKFYRIRFSREQTIVLVKYTLEHAENQRYVEIAEFLAANGIRAPKIYFHDPAEGLIWIEDLGERDLWSYREESWLVRRAPLRIGAGRSRETASRFRGRLGGNPARSAGAVRRGALSLGAALFFRQLPRPLFPR